MAYTYPELKSFVGLHSQANSLTVPDGALEEAENVVISRDGVISKRRGFYLYYDPTSDTLNSLCVYESKLLAIFSNKVASFTDAGSSPNYTGTRAVNSGATVAVTGTRVSRTAQSNNNLYFTTDNGLLKLESYNGTIYKAGVPPALDLRAKFLPANGPISAETQVAWRHVFGRRDSNDNLLLGTPSDLVTLTNSKVTSAAWTRTTNVVTVTSADHGLSTGMQITTTNPVGGTHTAGVYTVTVTSSSAFTFPETAGDDASGNTLDYTATRNVRLEASIPSEISSVSDGYFVQFYRSSQTSSSAVSPTADFKLIDERKLTSAEISAGVLYYTDDTDDILLSAELYTNPNSREGELQANDRPPLCDDIVLFKNHLIYANANTRHLLDLQVVDTSALANNDYIEVKVDATTRRYVARTGVGNSTVTATSLSGSGTITVTYASHGFTTGDVVYVSNVTGTLTQGTYAVTVTGASTFTIAPGGIITATALDFQGLTNGTYNIFQLSTASSASVKLRATAQGIVKAINRDASALVYAKYTSGLTEIPGKFRLQGKGFTGVIYCRGSTSTVGGGFSPVFPDSFASGDQVYSRNDDLPNFFYASKIGEPEAVPLINYFPVGARNKEILRVIALRDSMIVLKEDGVFRVNGDSTSTFTVTPLDQTVVCLSASSVAILNNQVLCLTNQGVCLISDSSVQIVSRKIEDPITAILGSTNLVTATGAVSYESDRQYMITTLEPNGSSAGVTYHYNVLNDSWTTSDVLFKQGVVGPNDTLYVITTGGKLHKERKNQSRIDFCGQNYAVTVNSISADTITATVTSSSALPVEGDVIVKADIFNRIRTVTTLGPGLYSCEFERASNLVALDSVTLYKAFTATVKLAPFHGGLVGRNKQFSQMQIHTRDESISRLVISVAGAIYGGSEAVEWRATEIGSSGGGWGDEPWGFFPWGLADGINNRYGTQPAPVIRIYLPLFQQRNTFIQPTFEHASAGEAMNIQAVSFAVRAYGERTSR